MVPFSHYLSSSRFKDVTTWSEQKSGLDDGVELVCFCRLELSGSVMFLGYVHTYPFSNQHRFQKSPFSPVHTTTQRFRKSPLSNPFSKVSTFKPVFESLRFRWKLRLSKTLNKRLRVDGRRKRTEKFPFSHENVYVVTTLWRLSKGSL